MHSLYKGLSPKLYWLLEEVLQFLFMLFLSLYIQLHPVQEANRRASSNGQVGLICPLQPTTGREGGV